MVRGGALLLRHGRLNTALPPGLCAAGMSAELLA